MPDTFGLRARINEPTNPNVTIPPGLDGGLKLGDESISAGLNKEYTFNYFDGTPVNVNTWISKHELAYSLDNYNIGVAIHFNKLVFTDESSTLTLTVKQKRTAAQTATTGHTIGSIIVTPDLNINGVDSETYPVTYTNMWVYGDLIKLPFKLPEGTTARTIYVAATSAGVTMDKASIWLSRKHNDPIAKGNLGD